MSDNKHQHNHEGHAHCTMSSTSQNLKPLKDPVCGMTVSATSVHQYMYQDKQFYFCNPKCLDKFKLEPAKYLIRDDDFSS
mgnify:CR=1 FL=1